MCVRMYVCEQLVLPESLLNYLKHAFRILNTMLLSLLLIFSGIFSQKSVFVQYDCICPTLDCLKKTICSLESQLMAQISIGRYCCCLTTSSILKAQAGAAAF